MSETNSKRSMLPGAAGIGPRSLTPEEVRRATLHQDAGRPKNELLEEAIRLSRFTVGLAAAGRRAKS